VGREFKVIAEVFQQQSAFVSQCFAGIANGRINGAEYAEFTVCDAVTIASVEHPIAFDPDQCIATILLFKIRDKVLQSLAVLYQQIEVVDLNAGNVCVVNGSAVLRFS